MQINNFPIYKFNLTHEYIVSFLTGFNILNRPGSEEQAYDILRSCIVFAVSALDTYIHELIISAILIEIQSSEKKFNIDGHLLPASSLKNLALTKTMNVSEVDDALRRVLKKESFQTSDSIGNALGKLGIKKIWLRLGAQLGEDPVSIKKLIDIFSTRRNSIAHESDMGPIGIRNGITYEDALFSIFYIKKIVFAIDKEFQYMI